jgi:hypothetical protein
MTSWVGLLIVLIAVALPISMHACVSGRLGINPIVGIRTQLVAANRRTWMAGHRVSLRYLYPAGGLAPILAATSFSPGFRFSLRVFLIVAATSVLLVGVIVAAAFATRAALDEFAREHPDVELDIERTA